MNSKILINAVDHEECRIARVTDSKLEEFHIESASREITQGNIYKGIITRIEPSLQAVFVDYGAQRHGFLQKNDIHRDYFHDSPNGDLSLNTIVKRGQEVLEVDCLVVGWSERFQLILRKPDRLIRIAFYDFSGRTAPCLQHFRYSVRWP